MKSPNIFNVNTRGFTLIEILVVLGILAVIAGSGLAFTLDSYRGYLFRSEYTTVTHMLAKARSRAINNFNESAHGLKILGDQYVLFVGGDYATSDSDLQEIFPRNTALSVAGEDEIVFEQLTGNANDCDSPSCTITFGYGASVKNITINAQGGIIW